jgi:hypothetical protein
MLRKQAMQRLAIKAMHHQAITGLKRGNCTG